MAASVRAKESETATHGNRLSWTAQDNGAARGERLALRGETEAEAAAEEEKACGSPWQKGSLSVLTVV